MRVHAYGRLHRYPARTWERVLARQGGRRVRRAREADRIVFGAGAASRPLEQLQEQLREARNWRQPVSSERGFLRSLGLLPPLAGEERPFSATELAQRARVSADTLELLAVFDLVEGEEGRFGFRAMAAAAQAARLLEQVGLADLVLATCQMSDVLNVAEPLSELRVTLDSAGRLVLQAGERLSDLNGQLRLGFEAPGCDVSAHLAQAEAARDAGAGAEAERILRRLLAGSPKDLDALFELGSLLCADGRFAEGLALLHKATRLRPGFADAWYNIGHAYERQGRRPEARAAYERALASDPAYADPLYNLGMMALDEQAFAEAVERFEAYLQLDAGSEWAGKARKALALARLSLVKAGACGAENPASPK
jgi:tetratricopeptide (TPR) repeat protein